MSSMSSLRDEAKESKVAKGRNMGVKISTAQMGGDYGVGKTGPAEDGTEGDDPTVYASGYGNPPGKTKGTLGKVVGDIEGKKSGKRLDRQALAKGGRVRPKGTTVNVVIAGGGGSPTPPMPVPPAAMGGLPPVPPPQGAPPMMPPMGRKRGGRVYDAGAGSGDGRLEKIKAYGKKAYEGAANKDR